MITKITIQVEDHKIKLTLDEARKLKEELDTIFNKEVVYAPVIQPEPYYPRYPWVTYTSDTSTSTGIEL